VRLWKGIKPSICRNALKLTYYRTHHLPHSILAFWCSLKLCSCNLPFKIWSWHQKKPSDGFLYSGDQDYCPYRTWRSWAAGSHLPLWYHLLHLVDLLTLWGMKSLASGAFSSAWDTLAIHSIWLFLSLWLDSNSLETLDTNYVQSCGTLWFFFRELVTINGCVWGYVYLMSP